MAVKTRKKTTRGQKILFALFQHEVIKEIERREVSIAELSRQCGECSRITLSYIKNANTGILYKEHLALAKFLGINVTLLEESTKWFIEEVEVMIENDSILGDDYQ